MLKQGELQKKKKAELEAKRALAYQSQITKLSDKYV